MSVEVSSEALAMQRAMPITRLLDCGLSYADAHQLFKLTSEGEKWDVAAQLLAQRQLERAEHARKNGFNVTACEAQAAGIAGLVFAQMAISFDTPRKKELYAQLVEQSLRLVDWSEGQLERVEVNHANSKLIGWLVRPAGHVEGTVLLFGGQSGWGIAYLQVAYALARRGIATLLAEGPGQGETRISQQLFIDIDVPQAYSAFVTHILKNPSLGKVGIWGNSFGGLWAAKTAATDRRIVACCVNGAAAAPQIQPFRTFLEQASAMLGSSEEALMAANFERMKFDSASDRIDCGLLVLHGGADPLVKLADQQPFLDGASSEKALLKVWPDGEHTIYNHSVERTAFVGDWFLKHFRDAS